MRRALVVANMYGMRVARTNGTESSPDKILQEWLCQNWKSPGIRRSLVLSNDLTHIPLRCRRYRVRPVQIDMAQQTNTLV